MKKFLPTILIFSLTIVGFLVMLYIQDRDAEELVKGYPTLEIQDEIRGVVKNKKEINGSEFIVEFTNGNKKYILYTIKYKNHISDKNTLLFDFIQINDSLFKRANSNEMLVYQKNKEYIFYTHFFSE